jgi:hypothetical protein
LELVDFWSVGGADVADILSAFLINGNSPSNILILNQEKVRVRVINGGASTSLDDFWG